MKRIYLCILLQLLCHSVSAAPDIALSMVPRGKLFETIGRDFVIKTPAGTKIDIEFTRDGRLEEAKGVNLNKGDELEPGDGLLSLSSVARVLQSAGIKPQGLWMLERDTEMGWIYEFEGKIVSAKTGKILSK